MCLDATVVACRPTWSVGAD